MFYIVNHSAVIGVCPTLFHPPFVEYDDLVISAVRGMGMDPVQWDVNSSDRKELFASEITLRITSKVFPFTFNEKSFPGAFKKAMNYILQSNFTRNPLTTTI